MSINLPLSTYQFRYVAQDEVIFPEQAGFLWHSVFGKSLHEMSCIMENTACEQCLLRQKCSYPNLFLGTKPVGSTIMRKYSTIPSPHVFRPPGIKQQKNVKPGDAVEVDVILPGNANQKLPFLVRAMRHAGEQGLGKSRGRIELQQVLQLMAGDEAKPLLDGVALLRADPPDIIPCPASPNGKVLLRLLTPYKASGKAEKAPDIDVGRYLMAIIRRVDLMQYFTTGIKLEVDFRYLKSLTQSIVVQEKRLNKTHVQRFSAAQHRMKDASGFTGLILLDLQGHEALWPFLWAGQWLNVGKNAAMGLGHYELMRAEKMVAV